MTAKKKVDADISSIIDQDGEPTVPVEPMKYLKQRKVSFRDKHAKRRYHPLGPPTQHVVGQGAHARVIVTPTPEVCFEGHIYATDDFEIAAAMIEDDVNFARPWGFFVNEDCLPEEIQGRMIEFSRANQRNIMRALVRGHTGAEALQTVDPALQQQKHTDDKKGQPKKEWMCPVVGCGKTVPPGGKNAEAALIAHVKTQHPDFEGSVF